jgi:aspartate-semialdehyde dehydrogenase
MTREVRTIIHELREQGENIMVKGQPVRVPVPVCKTQKGYFLPENLDEANRCCDILMNHAISEIVTRGNILEALPAYFENASARRMF